MGGAFSASLLLTNAAHPVLLHCYLHRWTADTNTWPVASLWLCQVMLQALVHHIHTNRQQEAPNMDWTVIIIIMIKTSEVTEKLTFDLFSLTWQMRLSAAQGLPETQRALWAQGEWRRDPQCIMGTPAASLGRAPLRLNDLLSFVSLLMWHHALPGIHLCRYFTGYLFSERLDRSGWFTWEEAEPSPVCLKVISTPEGFWVHLLSSLFCWHTHNAPGFLD